jgi:hypothetical protein
MNSSDAAMNLIENIYISATSLKPDQRTDHLFLFPRHCWQIFTIISVYLVFATIIGPKLMSCRKPFELRKPIFVYNVFMVILNVYFFFESICAYEFGTALLNFEYPTKQNEKLTPKEERRLYFVYWYFLSKLVDLMDTVFFVLRKKWSQVSPLHLYHHSSVPLCVWLAVRFAPTAGVNGIFPIFNSAVHVLMYTYYALAAFGPSVHKYLWWKKYITQVQLAQFLVFFLYAMTYAFKQTGWPSILICTSVAQPPLYLFMFTSFYLNTYCRKSQTKKMK